MRWRRAVALAIVVLFLGMTVSSASVEAKIVVQEPHGEGSTGVALNPLTPRNQSRPEDIGAIGELAPRILSIDFPIVGEIVIVAQLAEILVKVAQYVSRHTYGKPVAEFTKGFIEEIPAKHDGYTQVTKMNFWGTKVEIGYGYVKSEWWGLRKETVIVEHVITVNRDDVTAVGDLFSPEEYGKLLAMAWLNGWDAEKAKDIVEQFHDEYKDVFVKNGVTFRGTSTCRIKLPQGDVILDKNRASHIIGRHVFGIYEYDGQADPTIFPKYLTMREIVILIRETIEDGKVICKSISRNQDGTYNVVIEKTFPELRTDPYTSKTLKVVLRYNPKTGIYKIWTAYLKWLWR